MIFTLYGVINSAQNDTNNTQNLNQTKPKKITAKKEILPQKPTKKDENLSILFATIDKNLAFQKAKSHKFDTNQSKIIEIKPKFNDKNKPIAKKIEPKKAILPPILTKKPLLAVIIDDVGHFHQAKLIKQTHLKLTPSIFPVSQNNPNSATIAKDFEVFMIHLPLSAKKYKKEEPKTLHPGDSYEKIFARLNTIKADFPRLKIMNNHTGSEFTSNFSASNKLIKAAKMQNLLFLDSKTTQNSVILASCKKYKLSCIARDIFLDNILDKNAITSQLKQAIDIAKRRGYAIAIGHPHEITLNTLIENKNLLQNVEIVYIDRIYEEIYGKLD